MLKRHTILPGYELIAVSRSSSSINSGSEAKGDADTDIISEYPSKAHTTNSVLSRLRSSLKIFKQSIIEHRNYEEHKVKYMTSDMQILRSYVLHGVAPPVQCVSTQDSLPTVSDLSSTDSTTSEPLVSVDLTNNDIQLAKPPVPPASCNSPPPDTKLMLTFLKPSSTSSNQYTSTHTPSLSAASSHDSSLMLRTPSVPRIFTGESRTGEVWTGKELWEKYQTDPDALQRMISTCDGSKRLGNIMYNRLTAVGAIANK